MNLLFVLFFAVDAGLFGAVKAESKAEGNLFKNILFEPNTKKFFFCSFYIESRIVGGEESPRSYPYQISLQVRLPIYVAMIFPTGRFEYMHNCGGAIVTQNCVLTAAHCVDGYNARDLSILAGTNELNGNDGKRYFIETIRIHPGYQELVTNDIAVMIINSTFEEGPKIAPIR